MLTLRKIAITGGLSCGKSEVCRILKELGAYVVSADEIVHQLLSSHPAVVQKVVKLLGNDILVDQKIDRARVAAIVFEDPRLLRALEHIIHPLVNEEIEKRYLKQLENKHLSLFIAEIPLLFEIGAEVFYETTISVVAKRELCVARFKLSTKLKEDEFERRISQQLDPLEKAKRAAYVIMNNGSLSELEQITKELEQELRSESIKP